MRKYISIILVILLITVNSFPIYASIASPSNASISSGVQSVDELSTINIFELASSSDASRPLNATMGVAMLLSSGEVTEELNYEVVSRTVGTSFVPATYSYGVYNFYPMGASLTYKGLYLRFEGSNLPDPGKYGISVTFREGNLSMPDASTGYIVMESGGTGVNGTPYTSTQGIQCSQTYNSSGIRSTTVVTNIEIGYKTKSVTIGFNFSDPVDSFDCTIPYSPLLTYNLYEGSNIDTNTSQDVSSGTGSAEGAIADHTGQLVEGQEVIKGTIQEQVQYIINQLEAFWNQLYSYIFVPDQANNDENTNKITNSIDTMNSDLQDNLDRNTDDIMDNDDKNTNTIVNGYDESGITDDNDRLSSKLDEYDQQEEDLLTDVNDGLDGVDFDLDFSSVLSSIQMVSNFLQDIYDNSGEFKIVINCALLLSFGSCAVGLYRLKGGG